VFLLVQKDLQGHWPHLVLWHLVDQVVLEVQGFLPVPLALILREHHWFPVCLLGPGYLVFLGVQLAQQVLSVRLVRPVPQVLVDLEFHFDLQDQKLLAVHWPRQCQQGLEVPDYR